MSSATFDPAISRASRCARTGASSASIDEYGSRNGRIVAIGGGQFVLEDGHVIAAGRTAEIALNGKAAGFTDLQPGDEVSVRYNVETNEIREVLASRKIAVGERTAGRRSPASTPMRIIRCALATLFT